MAVQFQPPVAPSPNSAKTATGHVANAAFGDGYEQRARFGLNTLRHEVSLVWATLNLTEAKAIEDFFVSLGPGVVAFDYQLPWSDQVERWLCPTWDVNYDQPYNARLTAELRRAFDL